MCQPARAGGIPPPMVPPRTAVAAALAAHRPTVHPALPGRTNHLRAGVLVPLVWRDDGIDAILTLRSARLGRHPGEVAWPGGRPEPTDSDLLATALREAREEIGARALHVFGPMSSTPVYTSDFRLEPFVAEVAPDVVADGSEVERLLVVDLRGLLRAERVAAIAWELDGRRHLSPVWPLAPDATLFGATAHVLWELLTVLAPEFGEGLPELVGGVDPASLGLR